MGTVYLVAFPACLHDTVAENEVQITGIGTIRNGVS